MDPVALKPTGAPPGRDPQQANPPLSGKRDLGTGWLIAICTLASAAALPFVTRPLSSDEGGYLLVASQWHPGTSLYGNYWVDRPPLLIAIFASVDDIARSMGDVVALRLLGIGFTVVSILLAALLGRLAVAAPAREHILVPATVVAVFLSVPLFGAAEVNGERLAVPFVVAGCASLMLALRSQNVSSRLVLAVTSGALAVCAALVKQNVVDVFVFAVALAVVQLVHRRPGVRAWVGGFAAGAALALLIALVWAWTRGTAPVALGNAVVTFRAQADRVISSSALDSNSQRLRTLVGSCAISGAPLVVTAALWTLKSRPTRAAGTWVGDRLDLRWPAIAVLLWEVVAVLLGGSYWSHYLIGLVPGIVLLSVAAGQRARGTPTWPTRLSVAYATVAVMVALVPAALHPSTDQDAAVVTYLRDHSTLGDTVVVAFGDPVIVQRAGMSSPYSELWSLPVRVRDSHLTQLTHLMKSHGRPTWIVVNGATLDTWGVDAATAQSQLVRRYHEVTTIKNLHVYRADLAHQRVAHAAG